jgi:DNA ligase-associated metallophosphoesterase
LHCYFTVISFNISVIIKREKGNFAIKIFDALTTPNDGRYIWHHRLATLHLLKDKAIWLESENTLLLADTHFGKAGHFRKAGIPVPEGIHSEDLLIINKLLSITGAEKVIFLGDLFHSYANESWFTLIAFIDLHPKIEFHLIKGNHDILPEKIYKESALKIHPENLKLGSLLLSHEPMDHVSDDTLNICGHIHPGIVLKRRSKQSIRLPAFYHKNNCLMMPAFGQFTGLFCLDVRKAESIMVTTPDKVIPIKLKNKVG